MDKIRVLVVSVNVPEKVFWMQRAFILYNYDGLL